MEDIEIGRRSPFIARDLTVAITTTQLLERNPFRVGIAFVSTTGRDIWIVPGQDAVVGEGLTINGAGPLSFFSIQQHGELVRSDWNAISAFAATQIHLWEILLPEGSR